MDFTPDWGYTPVDDDDDVGPWGVYKIPCRSCTRYVVHVMPVIVADFGNPEGVDRTTWTCLCSNCAFIQRAGGLN